jgi:hypothetical protein
MAANVKDRGEAFSRRNCRWPIEICRHIKAGTADRKISQLNYLQFSDEDWEIWNNAFLYQNRLRAIDFVDMARAAGFSIEVDTSRPHPLRLQQLEAVKVHPRFARYSRDQLAITSIDFIGRNP